MKVTLIIGGEAFDCVPFSNDVFSEDEAVFSIICIKGGGNWKIIGIINNPDLPPEKAAILKQKKYWENKCQNKNIWIGTYKMPSSKFSDQDRSDFHKMLLKKYEL